MSPAPVARAGPGHVGDHRRRFVDRGSSANRDSGGADQLSPAVIARLLPVAGAIVLEMVWKNGALARSLIVEKMRCTDVKPTQLEFDIVKGQGIVVQPPASAR